MPQDYIMVLDQGTSSSRAIIFDSHANIVSMAQREVNCIYTRPGWVEQNPSALYNTSMLCLRESLDAAGLEMRHMSALGITNQRETVVVWDRITGEPVYNAIVWQCRRGADICDSIADWSHYVKQNCGLTIDPYFSSSKIKWILDTIPDARDKAQRGELLFGTVDSWLIYNLTSGKTHVTDYTNASRTMLFNIKNLAWDQTLLELFGVSESMLPEVVGSSGVCGYYDGVPIAGIAGDQQAALFGQTCFDAGECKNTYGTGCFTLMNTGKSIPNQPNEFGLISTIAYSINGETAYALEGSVFTGGALIRWLRDGLGIIEADSDAESLSVQAQRMDKNSNVYIVPAFTGLGAPYWDASARGIITGLTADCSREHIVRAANQAIAYQVNDLLTAMKSSVPDGNITLKVDGGASRDKFLLQFQADISDVHVVRAAIRETTALGAAFLAGLAAGVWKDMQEIRSVYKSDAEFVPTMYKIQRDKLLAGWSKAVKKCREN